MKTKFFCFTLTGLCVLFFTVCSCSTDGTAAQILGSSSEAPVFLGCKAVSETEINFQFSLPVKVVSLRFEPALNVEEVENGKIIRVHVAQGLNPGERVTADLLAEDDQGNTISVLAPFRARNSRIPALSINELRTEYSKPKVEYIEFKMQSAGNLGALRLYIAGNYKNPLVYEFSPIEVQAGEYVLLHLRSPEDTCRDELDDDLDESGGTDAVAGARDLWIPGSAKLLHKTDIVYVLDQDDRVIDAVMLSETNDPEWTKDYFTSAAEMLFSRDAWKSAEGKTAGPADAVDTSTVKTAMARSISRNEDTPDTDTAEDWYIASGTYSPGKPNK